MAALQLTLENNTNNVDESKSNDLNNSRSILAEILKMPADGTIQRYKYNKDQLVALSRTTAAQTRPHFLKMEFFNESGVWDPEKWVLSERNDDAGGSGSSKGQATSSDEPKSKRERPADLDRESLTGKRRSADPKERLKEDQDGIILSPQRRSFGTGCHVTQPLSSSSVSSRRSESPPELRPSERENHREPSRRIGSGRFFSRERDRERDYGYRSVERHDGASGPGSSSRNDRSDRERGNSRGSGLGGNERFRRDDNGGRMHRDISKDYDRRSKDKNFRRIEEEEEPEWFSGGPTSQSETIELRGFDDPHSSTDGDDRFKDLKRERRKSWRKSKTPTIEEEEEVVAATTHEEKRKNEDKEVLKMEEAAVRSEGDGEEDPVDQSAAAFDFEDLFKFDTMSSMFPTTSLSPETVENNSLIGSRFGQFFRKEIVSPTVGTAESSGDTSRRSSFQDELIAPIISNISEATEMIASPTSGSDTYFAPISPAQLTKRSAGDNGKQLLDVIQSNQHRDEMFGNQNNSNKSSFEQVKDISKIENDLKNLVLGRVSGGGTDSSQAESMNAFEKLLSQISDGRVTPTSRANVNSFEAENKLVQGAEYQVPLHSQSKLHMLEVLKNAPTEQDILNGFLPAINSAPPNSMRPPVANQHQSSSDFLSTLFQSQNEAAHQPKTPTTQSNVESLLLAAQSNYMAPSQARSAQESGHKVPAIQQQQREILAAILKQQQQQQQHVNSIAAPSLPNHSHPPPIIQRPLTSPGAPPLSPGSVSPVVASAAASAHPDHFVHHQQRPNIPSPLVFRQDPPAISHAPSPIHPAQIVQSIAPLNPNTLQAGHILARVPSPQELRAHTQQIMQNALIKKKLEEQKENYRKRQEMQESQTIATPVNKPTPAGGGGLSPSLSIIPTSVMRKMQVGNKDKDQNKITASQQQQQTLHSLAQLDAKLVQSGVVYSSDLEKLQKQSHQTQQQRPVLGQSYSNGSIVSRGPMVPQPIVASNSATSLQGQMQGRRIVKSNQQTAQQQVQQRTLNQQLMNQNKNYLGTPTSIDIAKQMLMQQQAVAAAVAAQRQMNISPMSALTAAAAHPGLPTRPTNFSNPSVNPVRPAVNLSNNNLFMRNLVHTTPSLSQYNQVTAAYQRHNVDPRQLQIKGQSGQSNLHQLLMGGGQPTQQRAVGSGGNGIPVGSRPIQAQSFNNFLKSVNMSGGSGSDGTSSGFDKWFSADLRHKMTNLPPVPTQKAQYVEQLES